MQKTHAVNFFVAYVLTEQPLTLQKRLEQDFESFINLDECSDFDAVGPPDTQKPTCEASDGPQIVRCVFFYTTPIQKNEEASEALQRLYKEMRSPQAPKPQISVDSNTSAKQIKEDQWDECSPFIDPLLANTPNFNEQEALSLALTQQEYDHTIEAIQSTLKEHGFIASRKQIEIFTHSLT